MVFGSSMTQIIFSLSILLAGCLKNANLEGIYPVCCETVSGSCRSACHKITLIDLATKPDRHRLFKAHLEQHCESSRHAAEFMRCFNNTTRELQRGSNWPGRECCLYARDPRCRVACIYVSLSQNLLPSGDEIEVWMIIGHKGVIVDNVIIEQAQSIHELEPVCWLSKESGLYGCFQSRDDATQCCNFANKRNGSSGCHSFCMDLLPASISQPEFSYGDLILLHPKCSDSSEIVHCVWGLGKAPQHPLECGGCCNASSNSACQTACHEVYSQDISGIAAIELLISSGCGPPDPMEPFWICLLKSLDSEKSTSFIASKLPSNPDSMKLHCCLKATTFTCRKACFQAYSTEMSVGDFDDLFWDCLEKASEFGLRSCLGDVSMPCQLGCSNLNFCSHFNDHLTQSFRSCNTASDNRAEKKFEQWALDSRMTISNGTQIDLKFDKKCTELWHGIVCRQHIQPCDVQNWNILPCRTDCTTAIAACLLAKPSYDTINAVCDHLFPVEAQAENTTCSKSPIKISAIQSTEVVFLPIDNADSPCFPNPCPEKMGCRVRRQSEKFANTSYDCLPGCVVSSQSSGSVYVVAQEEKIIMPYQGVDEQLCYSVCTCTTDGMMTNCEELGLCEKPKGCLTSTNYYEHGSSFQRFCSRCVCLAEELICSAGYCLTEAQRDEERNALTGLPCSCPTDFNRVCGLNGKTYPTECSARCSGLSEYHFKGGICSLELVCPNTDCGPDRWCVERSEVCLDHQNPCQQHSCVDIKTSCLEQKLDIACDTEGDEHPNLCTLLLAGRKFHYMGKCLKGCSSKGPVCGQNSETFSSQCASLADRVGIDYPGRCITVGGRIEKGLLNTCLVVEKLCPPRALKNCISVVPPDACCSVCAGALRVLFSKRRLQRLAHMNVLTITSRELITELQHLVMSSNCQVLGYLTMENDIVVLVQRLNITGEVVSLEEHMVCIKEAERLHYLINSQHPLITINARLWPLAASRIIHSSLARSQAPPTVIKTFAQTNMLVLCLLKMIILKMLKV